MYEIDTALRPNGNSGLLVSSIEAFSDYQSQRGSNTAWLWEHQAMTRARFCVGDAGLRESFDTVRRQVLCAPREPQALAAEIIAMRDKLRDAYPVPASAFDFKHSHGGMMDAEFAVQFLVLAYAATHPGLQVNIGNIGLLLHAEHVGLLAHGIGERAAWAYRELRHRQHQARLDEQAGRDEPSAMAAHKLAILALWHAVFGPYDSTPMSENPAY
jgi:glutamate-ammonia-ligase adenylyltransferase